MQGSPGGPGGDILTSELLPADPRSQLLASHEFPDPEDIAGFTGTAPPPPFVPRFCKLDKKVLRFYGQFSEQIPDGLGQERSRVRTVHLLYFLEDDTLSLLEPRLHNSGLDQGVLLKRHRVPRNPSFQVRGSGAGRWQGRSAGRGQGVLALDPPQHRAAT